MCEVCIAWKDCFCGTFVDFIVNHTYYYYIVLHRDQSTWKVFVICHTYVLSPMYGSQTSMSGAGEFRNLLYEFQTLVHEGMQAQVCSLVGSQMKKALFF